MIGDIVAFLTVYTFEFIYVMFVLSITIWISKKHVDFCNKDAIWNGSQLEKKDKSITNLSNLENLWTIPKIITITKRAVILTCSGKKEMCVCLPVWEWMRGAHCMCVTCWVSVHERMPVNMNLVAEGTGY